MKTKNMIIIALMTSIICMVAPFVVPLPFTPVPFTLSNLIIYILSCVLGSKKGTISVILYLLLGIIGLPVFSGFSAGLPFVVGPTGGYLVGFIFCAVFTGIFVEKFEDKVYMYPIGMIIGTIVCYIFGTLWLAYQLKFGFIEAVFIGVIPYLIGDGLKILVATILGYTLRTRLISMNLISS